MIALLASIVCAILFWTDLIGIHTFIWCVAGALIAEVIMDGTYFGLGWFKFYCHDLLGWHIPDESTQWFDGCSRCAVCKYCGKYILQDSQGNWFSYEVQQD